MPLFWPCEALAEEPVKPTQTSDLQNCEGDTVLATKLVEFCYTTVVNKD